MKTKTYIAVMLAVILVLAIGLTTLYVKTTGREKDTDNEMCVVTSFYPMYIATMNVAADVSGVRLVNMSEPQTGCLHDFQMTPEDMRLLSTADVFVTNGGGIESFMGDVLERYPDLFVVTVTEGINLISEDEDGEDEVNAHAWTSIADYKEMVAKIADGLSEADPEHAYDYRKNADDYLAELSALEETEQELLVQTSGERVILFHEAFAYLAEELQMEEVHTMDLDEERQISAGEVAEVIRLIREHDVKYILAEEAYGAEMGRLVSEETGVVVLYLNPLTKAVDGMDDEQMYYLQEQSKNLEIIRGDK